MANVDEALAEELELLRAVWPGDDELVIRSASHGIYKASLIASLLPRTAGIERAQLVRCELLIDVPFDYPTLSPRLSLGSSRGLSDHARGKLLTELESLAASLSGEPALYALLEAGCEALTGLNAPAGECAICLGSLEETDEVLRTPCFHVFHIQCFADFWQCEKARTSTPHAEALSQAGAEVACPECRSTVSLTQVPQLVSFLPLIEEVGAEAHQAEVHDVRHKEQEDVSKSIVEWQDDSPSIEEAGHLRKRSTKRGVGKAKTPRGTAEKPAAEVLREEAFVRLHHLWQGTDEKERPLLRLLKELNLDATIFYGRPAMLHIQGEAKDVDSFAGLAKRRHITISIQVAQRSCGPAIVDGVTSAPAKKGSLDGVAFATHLEERGLGETSFSILGSS